MSTVHLVPHRFDNKVAIVTGAASGIGRAVAGRLCAEGASVLAMDVQEEALIETVASITESGGTAIARVCDVSDSNAATDAVAAAVDQFGGLNALCNVAGVLRSSHTHEETDANWDLMIGVNLSGPFYLSRAALPHLLPVKGAIVNISSTAGVIGQAYLAAYCASKHGLIGLTKAMAIEYSRKGLRVNAICPGGVDTALTQTISFPDDANFHLIMRAALGKESSTPDDIANMVAWVASDEATYVNGAVLSIDAGVVAG